MKILKKYIKSLHRKPLDIYVYGFLHKKEVLEFLKNFETDESEELIEDIKNNKSLYKFKEIILEEFKDPKLLE